MTAPRNDEIQTALITKLKATAAIVAELVNAGSSSTEIREDSWQGTEFEYPNIRVRMISNNPIGELAECSISTFSVSIMVFSESYSSLESDKIAGIISTSLNRKSFTTSGIYLHLKTTDIIPATRVAAGVGISHSIDIRTWRAECLIQGDASKL
jgi:hypothetical protein